MRVFFLNPPFKKFFSRAERSPQVSLSGTLYYPVWLALASAMVEKYGNEIYLLDAVADSVSLDGCINQISSFNPSCLVMEASTASWHNDNSVAKAIKDSLPHVTIVFVGTHASALSEKTLIENDSVDVVVRGEYEQTLVELLMAIEKGLLLSAVKGITYRSGEDVVKNIPAEPIANLDEIPFASGIYKRFLTHRNYYFAAANYPGVMMMTGRGCPNRCIWCVFNQTLFGRRYRHRSAMNIVEEFECIIETFPDVKEIWIEDDTFTIDKRHLTEVCNLILQKKLTFRNGPFKWYCNARPPLDIDTMRLMKEAGCRLLVVGFESGDTEILNNMRKGFSVEQSFQFMKDAKKTGLLVHGCFVFGNPGETRASMEKNLHYAKLLRPDSAQFYFIHPYPGTEYYAWAVDNGYLNTEDFSQWLHEDGSHKCLLNFPDIKADELEEYCRTAYRKYHLNLGYIAMKLVQLITRPGEGMRSIRAGINFFMGLHK